MTATLTTLERASDRRSRQSRPEMTFVRGGALGGRRLHGRAHPAERHRNMKTDTGKAPLPAAMVCWWLPLAYCVANLTPYLQLVLVFGRKGGSHHG
jgi:hypothetical protein